MSATVMQAKDTIFAALAECYCDIEGVRYNFMQMINLEANFEKNKSEVDKYGMEASEKTIADAIRILQ